MKISKVNGMHSDNGVRIHTQNCKGKLKREVHHKPHLGGYFEAFRCDSCNYLGRGEKLSEAEAWDEAPTQVSVDVES